MKRFLHGVAASAVALFSFPGYATERYVTATVYHQWYHGRPDACGTTYSDHKVSAAHPWLPCGTKVRVVHKGKALVVPITDRCECNSIDLSYKAAKILGVPTDGIARVRIKEL